MTKYFATHSGKLVNFQNITADDISIEDIAHHLCNINRFGGALPFDKYYSVANHSIALAGYIYNLTDDPNLALHALLHDASEAYLGDVVSALKGQLPDYQELEEHVQASIYDKYGVHITEKDSATITYYDKAILLDEVVYLIPDKYDLFSPNGESPIGVALTPNLSKEATYKSFMWWFEMLQEMNE